jgi:hypothetical protein
MADDKAKEADEAKALGNAAFKAKQYPEAVTHFTAAIAADPKNHVLYSNRSAAHAAAEEYKSALLDANKCIDLKPDWAKGHSRRGAAYVGLKNWRAAIAAYEAGLELDPASSNIKEELALLQAKLSGGSGATMPNSGRPTPATSSAAATTFLGRMGPRLNVVLLLSAFFYVVPLLGPRRTSVCYRVACGTALLINASRIFARHGLKLATLRDPVVRASQEAQLGLICLVMLTAAPLPFALVPFATHAVHAVAGSYGAALQGRMPALVQRYTQPRLSWLLTAEGGSMVEAFAAISELMVLLMVPVHLLLHGFRLLVLTVLYFQYVSRRHAASFWTRQATTILAEKASGFFHHRYCPSPIGALYDRLFALIVTLAARVR